MIKDYKDLEVWKESIILVEEGYKVISTLPPKENYSLTDQIRRSAISVPSNIAEGHERQTTKEFIQFLYIASASASELETQLIIANRIYSIECQTSFAKIIFIKKMLYKLISSLKRRIS
ncbi:MAG: four helix bundle protein [Lentisphaerota bacterium]